MIRWYDRDGLPHDGDLHLLESHLADPRYKRVRRSKVLDAADPATSYDVSTVWMGIDHQHDDGPPLIFETMAFPEGSFDEAAQERYATEAEAEQGHTAVVATLAATLADPLVLDVAPDDETPLDSPPQV